MQLILHIGTEKTGSSSLQVTLANHRMLMAEQGLWYPDRLGKEAHRRLSLYGRDYESTLTDARLAEYGVGSLSSFETIQLNIEKTFAEEVQLALDANCRYFLVSCEYFSSLYSGNTEVRALAALCKRFFDDIRVVCFLRPQLDVLVSRLSTLACDGIEINESMMEGLACDDQYFNFYKMLARWEEAFGHDTIFPISYNRVKDVLGYFSRLTGVAIPSGDLDRINQSVDVESAAILNSARLSGQALVSVATYLKELKPANKISLTKATAMSLQDRFFDDNVALARKWPMIDISDLTPDWGHYPLRSNTNILKSAEPFAKQLHHIFNRFQNQIALQRSTYNYVQWQDIRLVIPKGHFADSYLAEGGVMRSNILPIYENLVPTGGVVIDVGANIGFFTLIAARRVGRAGKVVAVDPSVIAITALLRACVINEFDNITAIAAAAYDRVGSMAVVHNLETTNCVVKPLTPESLRLEMPSDQTIVAALQLDNLTADCEQCDMLRIAVGGNEHRAIRGAKNLLERYRPVVISEYSPDYQLDVAGNTPQQYLGIFSDLGYECAVINDDCSISKMDSINELLTCYRSKKLREGFSTHLDLVFTPRSENPLRNV